jgi:hypothetical protein
VRGRNNNENYRGTPALRVFVVSGDGSVVRGVLVDNTASTLETTPPVFQGSSSISRNRAFRTATNDPAIPVATLAIQAGDRLVVEVGVRDNSTGTSASATVVFGDNHQDDLLEGDSSSSTALNPWIEFSHDFFATGGGS